MMELSVRAPIIDPALQGMMVLIIQQLALGALLLVLLILIHKKGLPEHLLGVRLGLWKCERASLIVKLVLHVNSKSVSNSSMEGLNALA